ncbi:MAG: riboflavin biosynthesis protein RibF [Gemmatimonadota bacterium]|nr:riboflavin biosynthesis protein RibF [Gemmatimonadota bacterium]
MICIAGSHDLKRVGSGPLAVALGVFDGVHRGHRAVLAALRDGAREARAASMVVTFDPHPLEVLRPDAAPMLLTTVEERLALLGECAVDAAFVYPFDPTVAGLSPGEFLARLVPPGAELRLLVAGHDFRMGKDRTGGTRELRAEGERRGFRVVEIPATMEGDRSISSSWVRALLTKGRVREATELLGHRYTLEGTVGRGRGMGRKLQFPTANVDTKDRRKLLPLHGVYAAFVSLKGEDPRNAVVNIGTRPTFGDSPEVVVEAHIPGFSRDLSGAWAGLALVERIRDERRFASPEALSAQISADVEVTKKVLEVARKQVFPPCVPGGALLDSRAVVDRKRKR